VKGLDFPHIGDIPRPEPPLSKTPASRPWPWPTDRLTAVADDSGLCVDALSGAPGVHSARYSGEQARMPKTTPSSSTPWRTSARQAHRPVRLRHGRRRSGRPAGRGPGLSGRAPSPFPPRATAASATIRCFSTPIPTGPPPNSPPREKRPQPPGPRPGPTGPPFEARDGIAGAAAPGPRPGGIIPPGPPDSGLFPGATRREKAPGMRRVRRQSDPPHGCRTMSRCFAADFPPRNAKRSGKLRA
jgi:hypothetical protein